MLKFCPKCSKEKSTEMFGRDKYNKDGLNYVCKKCKRTENLSYYRTKKGLITKIYKDQKKSCLLRNHKLPKYTKKEFSEWMFIQVNFDTLYNDWVESGFNTMLVPSVDRLNDYETYCLNNIRLTTWKVNKEKGYLDRVKGINTKLSKPVQQFTLEGNFIKEFFSQKEAELKTGVKQCYISRCCNNIRNKAGGFIWKFKAETMEIYTDGGFSIEKNKGGFGMIVVDDTRVIHKESEIVVDSTNNRMELTAFIKALEYCSNNKETSFTIHSDSNYVLQGFKTWMHGWYSKNWTKADGKPVKNKDLWEKMYNYKDLEVSLNKVKAHQKNPEQYSHGYWNNIVDELTR